MLPHLLGLIGEGLNLLGALVMALDIFLRRKEHRRKADLEGARELARFGNIESTIYEGYLVNSDEFTENVLNRRSVLIAYGGAGLLALGFLFLAFYHIVEIRES